MQDLRIHLLGGLSVYRDGHLLPGFATQKARGLFAYLALNHGRSHPRATLVGRFWGESPERVARKNLRTDIWRIRSVLEPVGVAAGSCLTVSQDEVGFNAAGHHWLDIHDFEARLDRAAAAPPEQAAPLLRQAVEVYRGDLLEGLYDDWCLFERERLRLRYLDALERLVAHHRALGEWTECAGYAQRILAHDPLREHVHREVIRCHLALGDRAAALRQYEACAGRLRQELEVEPAAETRVLVQELRGAAPAPLLAGITIAPAPGAVPPAAGASPEPAAPVSARAYDEALARLRSVQAWLEETGEQLQIVMRDVERARALAPPQAPHPPGGG
ncbi:MAG TPA: BTAD domain-containing putative transcriptional regulator [Longimicrobium sp.]|nr:BTAD domain-containing putative transcriptional regulator [Longimicrobium sp.]